MFLTERYVRVLQKKTQTSALMMAATVVVETSGTKFYKYDHGSIIRKNYFNMMDGCESLNCFENFQLLKEGCGIIRRTHTGRDMKFTSHNGHGLYRKIINEIESVQY